MPSDIWSCSSAALGNGLNEWNVWNGLNDWNGLNETVQIVQKVQVVQAVIEKAPEASRE
jgi:hypothetical protein